MCSCVHKTEMPTAPLKQEQLQKRPCKFDENKAEHSDSLITWNILQDRPKYTHYKVCKNIFKFKRNVLGLFLLKTFYIRKHVCKNTRVNPCTELVENNQLWRQLAEFGKE